ncbi:MAG TPA: aminoacyl-tRNA hydrolase [Pyrinomonadaceae bacterium]|nr:aminoacyl-tRNA hydrolase [Pyrinomonadaceae bacterium]HMP65182.1 aminoacyl-tRNA hydrolase [Pyrinomonadaceae bacterium]
METLFDNWLIVGLGNPGERYERTRHNLGFMVVDRLAQEAQTAVKREECRSLIGRAVIEGQTAELVKPLTFMNLSGEAVSCLLRKPGRSVERLILISDDLALPLGKIRIRPKGSHGGHNGLRSVFSHLGSGDIIRVRIGIMPEHPVSNTSDFVLQNFAKAEVEAVNEAIERSARAVRMIISDGTESTMAEFN